jgi:hypothetical protein
MPHDSDSDRKQQQRLILKALHTQDTVVTSITPGGINVIDVTAGTTHAVSFFYKLSFVCGFRNNRKTYSSSFVCVLSWFANCFDEI